MNEDSIRHTPESENREAAYGNAVSGELLPSDSNIPVDSTNGIPLRNSGIENEGSLKETKNNDSSLGDVASEQSDIIPDGVATCAEVRISMDDEDKVTEEPANAVSAEDFHATASEVGTSNSLGERSQADDMTAVYMIYQNQGSHPVKRALETIFEEPKVTRQGAQLYTSVRKYKRLLDFDHGPSQAKLRKRKERAEKINGFYSFGPFTRLQASLQNFEKFQKKGNNENTRAASSTGPPASLEDALKSLPLTKSTVALHCASVAEVIPVAPSLPHKGTTENARCCAENTDKLPLEAVKEIHDLDEPTNLLVVQGDHGVSVDSDFLTIAMSREISSDT